MKKFLSIASTAFVLLAGIGMASPASAEALPTTTTTASHAVTAAPSYTLQAAPSAIARVTYEYNCVSVSGASYFMAAGSRMTDCAGSRLQKYLNGAHIATYTLSYGGGAASTDPTKGLGCAIKVSGNVALLILNPATGWVGWVVKGAVFGGSNIGCLI